MEKRPKIELPKKPPESETEIWGNEEGGVGLENKPETKEDLPVGKWWKIMFKFKDEIPPDILQIIERGLQKGGYGNLSKDEIKHYHTFRDEWWLSKFGLNFKDWLEYSKKQYTEKITKEIQKIEKVETETQKSVGQSKKQKKNVKIENIQSQKHDKMEQLHRALKNLDEGEPVDEFRDEVRKILYFDENTGQYFVKENEEKRYLGIGDVLADYAWNIKYVPDGEMVEPAYRKLAKNILLNETRRDIEDLYDRQLQLKGHVPTSLKITLGKLEEWVSRGRDQRILSGGVLAERIAREYLTRFSINENADFVVIRANIAEDENKGYDFKIRRVDRLRGVSVADDTAIIERVKKLGIQFKSTTKTAMGNFIGIHKGGRRDYGVDDVILIRVATTEFLGSFEKWIDEGKPSGGPEQFLSSDLKDYLVQSVTEGMTKIKDMRKKHEERKVKSREKRKVDRALKRKQKEETAKQGNVQTEQPETVAN